MKDSGWSLIMLSLYLKYGPNIIPTSSAEITVNPPTSKKKNFSKCAEIVMSKQQCLYQQYSYVVAIMSKWHYSALQISSFSFLPQKMYHVSSPTYLYLSIP